MNFKHAAFAALLGFGAQSACALSIEYDYSFDTGFFAPGSQSRATFEAAGNFFATRITDTLLGIDSGGGNNFTATFINPSSGLGAQIANLDLAADTIRVIPGARNLGASTLGEGGPGGYAIPSGSGGFMFNAVTRGQGGFATVSGVTATDFSPWGGTIVFDADTNWNFNLDSGPAAGQFDFLSVALHEFGHIFGVGTAWSWANQIGAGNLFTGTATNAVYESSVPLQGGVGAHWAEGTTGTVAAGDESFIVNAGEVKEAAFDPSLQIGRRKLVTELDLAALADIGWDLAEPAALPVDPHSVPMPDFALFLASVALVVIGLCCLPRRVA